MKFTNAEAKAIRVRALASVAGARADMQSAQRQRDGGGGYIVKTSIEKARVVDAPAQRTMGAQTTSWIEWVDARIEEKCNAILEVVAKALDQLVDKQHESIQDALDRRDHAIQVLRDEVEIKIGLGRKLARLKAAAAEARQQAHDRELESLRRELATLRHEVELKLNLKSELAAARAEVEEFAAAGSELRVRARRLAGESREPGKADHAIARRAVAACLRAEEARRRAAEKSPAGVVDGNPDDSLYRRADAGDFAPAARKRLRSLGDGIPQRVNIVTTDEPPLARMDVPEVRAAYIDLRIAELRVLAAQTAVEFWREQPQPSLRLLVRRRAAA